MANQFEKYNDIPKNKFNLASKVVSHDLKFETKPVSALQDSFRRFAKNKASLVGAIIILILLIYAIVGPMLTPFEVQNRDGRYKYALPKIDLFEGTGFWDGTEVVKINQGDYDRLSAISVETNKPAIVFLEEIYDTETIGIPIKQFVVRRDSYLQVGVIWQVLPPDVYAAIQSYQDETGVQVIYPVYDKKAASELASDGNFWYETDSRGRAVYDSEGNFKNIYLPDDGTDNYNSILIEGNTKQYSYGIAVQGGFDCRLDYEEYYIYTRGYAPASIFGRNEQGQDIFTCLASGARLSFLLAFAVATINLTIGAIYGAIEGYFGGLTDLLMERFSDILAGVPFIVVVTLFRYHVADSVGPIISLLFAFVLTGWLGMASRVRSQFYRFKNQEYILAARTLGAGHGRLMFKHIFPNSIGTIITGSVLVIPGVIFAESSLSYLRIIDLEGSNITSVGTLLSSSQSAVSTAGHVVLFPSLFIALLMICFNLFGNGLRDAFNPSLRGAED